MSCGSTSHNQPEELSTEHSGKQTVVLRDVALELSHVQDVVTEHLHLRIVQLREKDITPSGSA